MNEDKVRNLIHSNSGTFGKIISLAFLVFGILVVIGAIRNWDWLYKPDESYHNRWTIGQVSRYMGRNTARVIGLVGGILLILVGSFWSYRAFTRNE